MTLTILRLVKYEEKLAEIIKHAQDELEAVQKLIKIIEEEQNNACVKSGD